MHIDAATMKSWIKVLGIIFLILSIIAAIYFFVSVSKIEDSLKYLLGVKNTIPGLVKFACVIAILLNGLLLQGFALALCKIIDLSDGTHSKMFELGGQLYKIETKLNEQTKA